MKKKFTFILLLTLCFFITNAQSWVQIGEDIDGEVDYDYSGSPVCISSDGSVLALDGNSYARVYRNQNGTWTKIGNNIPTFGNSISLNHDGSIIAIGRQSYSSSSYIGRVDVFENQGENWVQIGQPLIGDYNDRLGSSVSLSSDGSILAVGAYTGPHAIIYQRQGESWIETRRWTGASESSFGTSISLNSDGSVLAVGASTYDGSYTDAGRVYIYQQVDGTTWGTSGTFDGEGYGDLFGGSVSLNSDGSRVAIGAIENSVGYGYVKVYENQSGTWTQVGNNIKGEAVGDYSGYSVSLSSDGSIVAIGARNNDGNGLNAGHVRVYQDQGGIWTQIGQDIDGEAIDDYSGNSVSLSSDGSIVAIGASYNDGGGYNAGQVRVYELIIIPIITSQPANQSNICAGTQVTYTVEGTNILAYQWQVSTDGGSSWTGLGNNVTYSGTTTGTLTVNTDYSLNNNQYRCYLVGPEGNITSNEVGLTFETVDPTISCTVTPVRNADAGQCYYTVTGTEFDPLYTNDNCGIASVVNNINGTATLAGAQITNGTEVTWTVTDYSSNTSQCSFTVTVEDNQTPTFNCITDPTKNVDAGQCYYTVSGTEFDPTDVNDNCGVASIVNDFNGSSTLADEQITNGTTITWTITDNNSNTAQCSYTVTVNDNENPVITSTHNDQIVSDEGNCEATLLNYASGVVTTDNCDASLDITQNPVAGTTISGSVNEVTLTVTDDTGNSSQVSFNVAVVDNTDPVITSTHNNQNIDADNDCQAALPDYTTDVTATDNCDSELTITQSPAVGTTISGPTNTVTLTVTDDADNYSEVTFNVEVEDNASPVISSTHDNQVLSADDNCQATLPDYTTDVTATDNCDSELTITQSPEAGTTISGATNTVILTVTDDEDNYSEVTFNVEVQDNTDPVITSTHNNQNIDADNDCQATLPDYTTDIIATDNCDTELEITQLPEAGTTIYGVTNAVILTVTDDAGNYAEVTFNVEVEDNISPVIISTHDNQALSANNDCQAALPDYTSSVNATDNCDADLTITQSPVAGTTISGTTNMVTLTVTDDAGNYTETTFNVEVEDNTSPVITFTINDQILSSDNNCQATLPDYTTYITATDNCDADLTITQSPVAGTSISGTTNTVTLTVTDDAGNYSQVTFNVEVEDNTNPVISSTHNDQTLNADNDCQATLPDYTSSVNATDNCDTDLTITQSPVAGTIISGTTNTVTLTVTDDEGNYSQVTFNVEVEDNTNPMISSTHNDQILSANNSCQATLPNYITAVTATDNCDADLTITQSPVVGTTISGTINMVTLTVTDDAGNYSEVTFNVEVQDNTNPVITFTINDQILSSDNNCQAALPDYTTYITATDNCDADLTITQSPVAGTTISGTTNTVTLTVTDDAGNYSEVTFNVEVEDNANPVISSTHNDQVLSADDNCQATLPDYTSSVNATDICDADLTIMQSPVAGTIISGTTNSVTLTVTDDAGNYSQVTFNVEVEDNTSPVISSTHNDQVLSANNNCQATLPNYTTAVTATDNCDANLTITQSPVAGTIISGITNTVTLTVTDDAGNYSEVTFNVEVQDNTNPVISSTHNDQTLNADNDCQATLPDYTSSVNATDNCDTDLTITQSPVAGTTISGTTNTVTLTVTDDAGNYSQVTFNVEVEDNTNPVISSTHNDQIIGADNSCQATLPNYTTAVIATDNCDADLTITQNPVAGTTIFGATNTVTLTVTDDAGNYSEVTFNVEVEDNANPVISSTHNDVVLSDEGSCQAILPNYTTSVTATDNCDADLTITQSPVAGEIISGPINEVTLTVTDDAGNSAQVSFNVAVEDNAAPIITSIHNEQSINAINASFFALLPDYRSNVTAIDNCSSNLNVTQSPVAGSVISGSTNSVTLTITDDAGNPAQTTFNVKVVDLSPPVISSTHNDLTINDEGNCQATLADYTSSVNATDIVDQDLEVIQSPAAGEIISGPVNEVTLTVTDDAGNYTQVSFNVAVEDNTDPVITSTHTDQSIDADENCETVLPDYTSSVTATDNCDTDFEITQSPMAGETISGPVNEVTLTVNDDAGNFEQVSFNVEVVDNADPVITSTHNNQSIDADANCEAALPDYTSSVTATDNCDTDFEITQSPVAGETISGLTNEVTLTVTDDSGNSDQVTFNIAVVDNTDPIITCIENQNFDLASGETVYTVTGTALDPVTTDDNCNIASILNDFNQKETLDGAEFTAGSKTVSWTITDEAGNEASCSFEVTINETTGIKDIEQYGISMYPNPTNGILYIESKQVNIQSVEVYDLTGKLIITKYNFDNKEIDLSGYSVGIYLVKINTDKESITTRIIKE